MTLRITNPVPIFQNGLGGLLDNGKIFIGVANEDPEVMPLQVYVDEGLTIPIDQPLRTLSGTIRNGASLTYVYVEEADFSMRVSDSNGAQISYSASYKLDNASFQPLDSDLTAIAALNTTDFGRSLLTLANQAALQSALGGLAFLPTSGGSVTGNITRQGAGPHLFFDNAGYVSGRVFIRATGSPDPSTASGDIVFYVA